jgi:uncharacterized protein GlcG (DUF336 family)
MTEFILKPRRGKPTAGHRVSLRDARRVIAAGEDVARSAGLDVHLVVLDVFGDLIAYARMDGVWRPDAGSGAEDGLIRRAIDLARSAMADETGQLDRFVSINHRDLSRRAVVVTAEPLWHGGFVVGAVGVSGLSGGGIDGAEADLAVAPTAAKVYP